MPINFVTKCHKKSFKTSKRNREKKIVQIHEMLQKELEFA